MLFWSLSLNGGWLVIFISLTTKGVSQDCKDKITQVQSSCVKIFLESDTLRHHLLILAVVDPYPNTENTENERQGAPDNAVRWR